MGKVVKRAVFKQLQTYMEENRFDPFESSRGGSTPLVLLELSSAFDTIHHSILLDRLSEIGIGSLAFS